MICAETLTAKTSDLTFEQAVEFLEPQASPSPGRGGAICQSDDDWNKMKTALEKACRELGSSCSYEVKQTVKNMQTIYESAKKPHKWILEGVMR